MNSRSLGHRAPLLWLVLPLLAGLAAGKLGLPGGMWLHLGIALGAAATTVVAAARDSRLWAGALLASMFFAGVASYALQRERLPAWESLPPREARLSLRVDRIFAASDPKKVNGLATVVRADTHLRDLVSQRLYFSLALRPGAAAPTRSTVISTVGVLVTLPRNPPTDSFDGYLAGAGMNFRLTRGRVLAEERPALAYYRFCARTAAHFNTILGLGIAGKRPELAGLLRAMMLGSTHELSNEQHTLFMQSGTMHLFAISGLNIGVIAGALQALLLLLRFPAWARFVVGTALLWLFVDITGGSPSAVRAFAMAAFLQAAFVFRRPGNLLAALVLSAFVVLVVSPLQVFSASFIMSYGIVTALLVLGLPLGDAWQAHWQPWRDLPKVTWRWWHHGAAHLWRVTAVALAVGIATTLVSLVTGVQFFRLLTPGALATNLVLIPAASLVTLGGFGAILCGLGGFAWGAALCNHAAALVLLVIEWFVGISVQWPGAFMPARFASDWTGPTVLGLLLGALLAGYAAGWHRRLGGWWPPFAIVAAALLFGVKFG